MHKERIFSASSGSHRGTSSGNMKPCPLRRCVVFSCPLLIFPALPPFPVLRSQAPPRGGENGAQPVLMERACPRAKGGAPALLPSCPACPWQGRALPCCRPRLLARCPPRRRFRLSLPSAPARLRVAFFAAPCRTFRRELLPYPMQCVAPRPARRRPCASSSLLSLPRFLPGLSVLRPLPGVAHAIRDSPADSAVARPHLCSVFVPVRRPARPVTFPAGPRLPVVPPSLSLAPCAPSHPFRVPRYPPGIVFHLPGWPSVPRGGPGA